MTIGHVSHQTPHASVVVSLGAIKAVRLGTGIDRGVEVEFEGGTLLTLAPEVLDDIMRERVQQVVAQMDNSGVGGPTGTLIDGAARLGGVLGCEPWRDPWSEQGNRSGAAR
ncbi:hypothetical protein [Mycobacteroides abscessus]|uniref:hypothetical protein n=1 Tax=Mycobacteroides abscessus TaxID=36809 RepID=UPI000268425F|nr:hypothetical protein [Mycobacteroides abscessus]QST90078.1 hypothetical protein PROPHIGD05-2_5 [Mycobacterium phage prophiGD05-2]SKO37239.1 Uncharacterised protein [Mycobacteroides abscessus subsp. bolletii]EIV23257.1 hypothetical protein MA3A0122R_4150 [Mycobacteroides abscessus 3A-0122-R]EIV24686.1 hypothetical protein MA3A0119R_3072 [Mycobacteroides abscessus 3A-0119-R]EIV35458.1 hypothetical protein MA3A0731_4145 [Mycobacteroides abscessus 3A-0731]